MQKHIIVVVLALAHVFVRTILRYLKSIINDSVTACDKIINVPDSVSTDVTTTISTKVMSTVPVNSDGKKVRDKMDYYIAYTFLLVTIFYHYFLLLSKP